MMVTSEVLILIRKQETRRLRDSERQMKVFESAALFLHAKSSFLVNEGEKMGQWPIFCGASLRLPRLALRLSSVSLPPAPSPSLRAFEQISIGSARRLIGHEAACEEKRRASSSSRPLIPYASSISPLGLSRVVGLSGSEVAPRREWTDTETGFYRTLMLS